MRRPQRGCAVRRELHVERLTRGCHRDLLHDLWRRAVRTRDGGVCGRRVGARQRRIIPGGRCRPDRVARRSRWARVQRRATVARLRHWQPDRRQRVPHGRGERRLVRASVCAVQQHR